MNKYRDIGLQMLDDERGAAAGMIQLAADTTPEQEAEWASLAERTGAPVGAVKADPEGARLAAQRREMAGLSPVTQRWLQENPNRYALVKDEVGALDKLGLAIRRSFQAARDTGLSDGWRTWSDHLRSWEDIAESGEAGFRASPDPFYVEELGTALFAGYQRALGNAALVGGLDFASDESRARAEAAARGLGFDSAEAYQASRRGSFAASQERRAQQIERTSAATDRQFENIAAANEADSLWEAMGLVARSPRAVGTVVTQSLGMGAPGLALTAATGGMGRLVTAGAAGGSSGWVEYGASISESLAEAGVDVTDPAAVARALRNPQLMGEARERAAKRSVPIALFDAATAGLAGQLLINARRSAGSAAARTAGEMGIQAAGGSLGELTAGLVAGEGVQWGDVLLEGIAEVPFGAVEARANYVTARERGQVRWINEQLDIVRRSSSGADALSQATIAAGNANLARRSPAEAQSFAQAAGAEGGVYIDAEAARTLFQDNWQTLVDAVGGDTALTEQLASGDVVIPADQYFAKIASLPNAQDIARNARTQADALSAVELEQYDIDALADALAGDTADAAARAEPGDGPTTRQRVQDDVYGQLIATDRYTDAAAEAQAKLWGAFFGSLENRYGVDGWALYESRMRGIRTGRADGTPDPRSTRPWMGDGRLDAILDSIRSGADPDPRTIYGPSLSEFLLGLGGVQDLGGDMRSMDAGRQRIGLINAQGVPLDRARELAAEAGYFGGDPAAAMANTTISDLLELVDRDLRSGDVFSDQMADRDRLAFSEARDEVLQAISENEYLRDLPQEQFDALTNQQLADILFGGATMDQVEAGRSRRYPLPNEQMETAPVGAWVQGPEVPGVTGNVFQVRDVPLDRITGVEFDSAGNLIENRVPDAERYAEAMRAGDRFPNLRGYELDNGMVQVMDGHRRITAARMAGLDSIPVAVLPADDALNFDQPAFHGTPHDVDRFSLQRIGTGEGNQAFGWGLYFASQQEVADFYRRNTVGIARNIPATMADSALREAGGDRARAVRALVRRRDALPEAARGNTQAAIDWLRRGQNHGRLYQVDIPEDSDLLDWDAPLSEQPDKVRQALEEGENPLITDALKMANGRDVSGRALYDMLTIAAGNMMVDTRGNVDAAKAKAASEALLAAGITGLRYLDGASRADGEGSHNFVIWDEASIGDPVRLNQGAAPEFSVDPPRRLYRGVVTGQQEDGSEGLGTFMLGRGLYTTPNREFAEMYGPVQEVSPEEAFPRNPLDLGSRPGASGPELFRDWLFRDQGFRSIREFNSQFPDPADYVRSLGYDGVIAGDEVVKYPSPTESTGFDESAYRPEVVSWARERFGDVVAPNGNPAWQNFVAWFGDSKAIDAEGRPLVVYHGGTAQDVFDTSRGGGGATQLGPGSYFGPIGIAEDWVDIRGEGRVGDYFLSMQAPFDETGRWSPPAEMTDHLIELLVARGLPRGEVEASVRNPSWGELTYISRNLAAITGQSTWQAAEAVNSDLRDAGFDGIIADWQSGNEQFVAFHPEQIKSASANVGNFDAQQPSTLQQSAAPAPTFYSAALRAIEQGRGAPRRADAKGWKGWLDGAQRRGEMRQAERDWLGIDTWLDEQDGPITREALTEFVRANQVQIEEVTLGEGVDSSLPEGWRVVPNEDGDGFELLDADGVMRGEGATEAAAIEDGQDRDERGEAGAPRYAAYQLPGGQNYREVLLTMPSEGREYVGPHYDEANILAHVRFNERTDADGKRVLFIEEIQSDWHQQGRSQGYLQAEADPWQVFVERGYRVELDAEFGNWMVYDENGDPVAQGDTEQDAIDDLIEVDQTSEGMRAGLYEAGVPDAPFKGTDEWAMLAFKRMVRHAVENGFERIAWTTGEIQDARYPTDGEQQEKISHGMAGFYDNILPKAVNKWAKKLGGRVGQTAVRSRPLGDASSAPKVTDVHALDITDKMRDAAMQGMTLFQSQPAGDRLVALHNLSAENLLFADQLGGLPAPSIGITKAASPFRGFGSISLIGRRSLAEPGADNPVFSADAYTQRFPEMIWPRVKSAKAEKFLSGMDDIDQVWDYLVNNPDRDRAIEVAVQSSGFMRRWLESQGEKPVENVTRENRPPSPWMDDQQLLDVIYQLQDRGVYIYDLPPSSPEAIEIAEAARGAIDRFTERSHENEAIRARLRETYTGESTFDPEGGLAYSVQSRLAAHAASLKRPPQVDRYATQQALDEQIGERRPEFERWVAEQVTEQFDEPKIQLGRRKVPVTLENVVEAMTRQRSVAGSESTMTFSSGQVAARNAKRYRTIEEIQADRDRIVSPDAEREAGEALEKQLDDYRTAAIQYFTGKNYRGEIDTWEALDSSMKSLADAAKKPATAANVAAALRRNGFEGFPDAVAEAGAEALLGIRQAVTDYFEAKPQRAVSLDEFAGAVIPQDASQEVRDVLDRHGIQWMEYGGDLTQDQAVSQLSAELDGGTGGVLFQPEGGAQPPRGQIQIYPDRGMSISLFESADRSTFLHESGHFFLEVFKDMAALDDAPAQVREDMTALLEWFGVESADQIGVEQHEQFARGFEKYLGEGRAPSPELQSVFSQFKAWLLSIYRNLVNLNVNLTDDVRGVMDRMLASEDEIEAAQVRQGMEPMDFGEGVLEADQIKQYADQLTEATERERAALAARLIAAHDRAAKRWYREQRAEVRKEVEAEYAAMPVYRAARVLAGARKYADGTEIPSELQGMKLNKAALVAVYGEEYLKRIRGMYRVKGGVDQDLAAMRLGFESGDALVTALANREDMNARVEAETDERMRERHGDPMTDGTLAERAMDAVHDDYRMRVLAWEMAVLEALAADPAAVADIPRPRRQEGGEQADEADTEPQGAQEGQQAPQRRQISPETRERIRQAQARRTAATRALAEAARRTIAGKKLRDIRPHDYLAAERKAARKATAAAAGGRYVEGLQAKRQQAFNAALYREAMRVQKRADSNVRFLRRAASDQTRARIGKQAGKFYVDALDAIFDGIEVRGASRPQVARRAALREWVARMQEEGNSTAVPEMLLARVEAENVTNLADMTVGDVEGLREAVENILHLARVKNRLQTAQGQREWEDVKAEMMERLQEQPDRHGRYGISDADRRLIDRIGDLYAAGSNWVLQPETMVEWLDGATSGPFHDLLWDMAQSAERKREALNRQVGNALQEALAGMPSADRKALDRRFHIESLGGDVSGHSILSALLNMGNEGNRDKLLRGGRVVGDEIVPFTEQQLADMFGRLTRPQAEVVQKVWDAIDQLWPEIVALEESMNGITPEKVEASQFTVMTRDGPVNLRGGYYPVMYDPKGARAGQFSEDEQAKRVLSGQTPVRASTSKGHIEKRTDFVAPLLLDYHSVITRHLDGVIGDISYRQFLRQVYKVLGDPDIRRMIDNRMGPGAATGLRQSFERGAVGYYSLAGPLLGPFQKVADAGMTNLSSAALGFRIPLAMANVVAVPLQAGARVKPRYVLRGLRDYYFSGGPNIIANMRRNAEMVQRLSPLMLRRSEARSVELSSIISNLRGKRGFRAKMIEMAMAMHQWTVPLAENAVWMGAYQQAQAGGATMQEAIAAADKAIRQTQTKTSAAELSRGEGGPMRMFMQFAGPLVIMNNRLQEAGLRGLRGDVHSWPQALGVWFAVAMGAAWSFELMMGRGPEGDDGEDADVGDWTWWAAQKLLLLPFAAFPLIRDVASYADSGFSRGTPLVEAALSIYEATVGTAQELFSDEEVNVEKVVKSQVRASGAAVGVPSNQLLRTGDYLMSVATGEHEMGNPAAEAYYLVQGAPDED